MPTKRFIQLILPIRIGWEPYYALEEGLEVKVGDRVKAEFAHREYIGVVSATDVDPAAEGIAEDSIKSILGKEENLPGISAEEIAFWRKIADYYLCTTGEVYKAAYPAERTAVKTIRKKSAKAENAPQSVDLSPEQAGALTQIEKAFKAGKTVLLEGVTGSGKTELYLKLAKEAIGKGKSVLYLVPEIALSRQLEDRVRKHFPEVRTYHSAKTPAGRRLVAKELREGLANMVLGTRSALFLPYRDLGLIIVDEEHDTSYKQTSPAPRYNARESAIMLASVHGANVILGSATPSLESLYNAQKGIFTKVQLQRRYFSGEDSDILIIDTIAERRKNGMHGSLSLKLLAEIKKTLEKGEQAILLRSRRSYAPAVQCSACGEIVKCPHCNVPMSLHKNPDRLLCHYCGHTLPYTGACPSCGGELIPLGAGTQKIEEELKADFPDARVARLDSDNASEEKSIIESFAKGEIDIIIGTQIVTKGFDFENLSLVAVIQADNILGQQNFRADERAHQLLQQFRGRSGRREKKGLFVIQTREPAHPVFQSLDGTDCADTLLAERQAFGYPPYTRLVHIEVRDSNEKRLWKLSGALGQELAALGLPITGPYEPAREMIAGVHAREIRVNLPRNKHLHQSKSALYKAVEDFERKYHYNSHIFIDVDPA